MLNSTYRANTHRILVAIDSQVDQYQHLLAGVIPGAEAIILNAREDGVEQLTQALRSRPHIRQLHLIAHGKPGWLQLGNSSLSLETLNQYAPQLQTWFCRPDVQLLLYGCQVAAGDAGLEFIEKLSRLTGTRIAASTTLTGSSALGGDWDLDVQTGDGEIAIALDPKTRATYASVLVVNTVSDPFPPLVTDPPILANQLFSVSTPERFIAGAPTEPIRGVLFNDSSTSGILTNQVLSASLFPGVTASTKGVPITLASDGSFTYNPTGSSVMKALAQGATTTDTFNYIAIDKDPRTAVGTVTITVTGVNDAPVAVADAFTASPNTIFNATAATGLRINDTDPDTGDTLTIVSSALSTTNGAIVSINGDGSFSYDPSQSAAIKALPQGASLTDTFTYTLRDASGATSVGNVTMTVNGINDPVIANNDTTATQTNKSVEIAVLSNDIDPDGNPINIFPLLVNQRTSQGGTITTGSSISTIAYTPPPNFTGTDTFTYTVTDGNSTSSAVVTINVTPAPPPNRPPVVGNDSLTINQGSTVKIDFLANDSDPDGDTFSLASFTNPNKGQVTVEGNQFVYTAPAGFVGNDGFQYTLIDSKGASSSGGVFFAVVQSGAPSPSPSPSPSPTPTPTPTPGEECTIAIASPVSPAPNAAADTLTGTTSDNLLIGNNNNNTIVSLDGDDLSVGLAGSDNLSGNKGADLLFGNQGNDVIEAGDGDDTLFGGKENDFLNGGLGADTIHADLGDDQVLGGDGNDFIEGGQGGDLIDGGAGNDSIDGGSENDAVKGGDGADVITGGAGSDALQGNAGDDALIGNADADVLDGCGGNDNLTGGDGNDTLYGGSGNDVLDGGLGNDLISGGVGTDRITLAAANGVDTVVNFTLGEDTLVLTGGLTVEQVSIIPQNNSTALGLTSSPGTVLAILQGVSSSTITASIFTVG
jgi:VCBS repeat-containing protein